MIRLAKDVIGIIIFIPISVAVLTLQGIIMSIPVISLFLCLKLLEWYFTS